MARFSVDRFKLALPWATNPTNSTAFRDTVFAILEWANNRLGPNVVPPGAIMFWGNAEAPETWLMADGTSYLRLSYPGLYDAIGTSFGAVDADHFNVPNLVNRFPLGASGGKPLGTASGAETHSISVAELPPHTHGMSLFRMLHDTGSGLNLAFAAGGLDYFGGPTNTSSVGSGTAMSLMPPYLTLYGIIKT